MFISESKLFSYKKLKTRFKLVFYLPLEFDELQLIQNSKTDGYLAFNPDSFKKEIEDFMKNKSIGMIEEGKSKSTILRGKIYGIWHYAYQNGRTQKTSEEFYNDTMNFIMETIISKI